MQLNKVLKNAMLSALLAQMPSPVLYVFAVDKLLAKIPLLARTLDNGRLVFSSDSVQVLQTGVASHASLLQNDEVMIDKLLIGQHLTLDSEELFGGGLVAVSDFEIIF